MLTRDDVSSVLDRKLSGSSGKRIGTVTRAFVDPASGMVGWLAITVGKRRAFVPARDAELTRKGCRVPFTKDEVKNAPWIDGDSDQISQSESEMLAYYYTNLRSPGGAPTVDETGQRAGGVVDDSRSATKPVERVERSAARQQAPIDRGEQQVSEQDAQDDQDQAAMTVSEEKLNVQKETVDAGEATLRKRVVTEDQTVTVPVSHDEVRLERTPADPDAETGGGLSDDEQSIRLTEERVVVVSKETVPVEEVRMVKEQVTEDQQITEQVRHEEVDTDGV